VSNSSEVQVNYNHTRTKGNNNFNNSRKDIECWYLVRKVILKESVGIKNQIMITRKEKIIIIKKIIKLIKKEENKAGGKIKCQNNEVKVNEEEDKHRVYFSKDYNDAYETQFNDVPTSILPIKPLSFYNSSINDQKHVDDEICSWTLDSGTTYHMTSNPDILTNMLKHNKKIYFANGEYVKSKGIVTYKGYINDNIINLKHVLYIPAFNKNLISVDGLSDQNYKTVFYKRIIQTAYL